MTGWDDGIARTWDRMTGWDDGIWNDGMWDDRIRDDWIRDDWIWDETWARGDKDVGREAKPTLANRVTTSSSCACNSSILSKDKAFCSINFFIIPFILSIITARDRG